MVYESQPTSGKRLPPSRQSLRLKHLNMRQVLNRPRGMNDNHMRILNGMLSEASRYIGNALSVVSEPSLDQAKEIDARLAELVSRIEAIRSTL